MSDQDTPPPMEPNPEDDNPVKDAAESAGEAVDKAGDSASEAVESAAEKTAEAVDSAVDSVKEAAAAPSTFGIGLGQGKLGESDEKTMGMLAHILGGVTCIIGPLIIWLIKREESPFVNDQGKEALNFQITILIGYVVAAIVALIPVIQCITVLLYPALGLTSLILGILGGLEANKGKAYRYPFALRLVN